MAIAGFKDKGLRELFDTGQSAKINPAQHTRILLILDFLNAIGDVSDCFGHHGFHRLKGKHKEGNDDPESPTADASGDTP